MSTAAERKQFRKLRVRRKVFGTAKRPRLSVFFSLKHTCAQLIDDTNGNTLTSVCTGEKELKQIFKNGKNKDTAVKVGSLLAQRAKTHGISTIVFDRGSYRYHGRVKSLADEARREGLVF